MDELVVDAVPFLTRAIRSLAERIPESLLFFFLFHGALLFFIDCGARRKIRRRTQITLMLRSAKTRVDMQRECASPLFSTGRLCQTLAVPIKNDYRKDNFMIFMLD